jgi:hypothetical protein
MPSRWWGIKYNARKWWHDHVSPQLVRNVPAPPEDVVRGHLPTAKQYSQGLNKRLFIAIAHVYGPLLFLLFALSPPIQQVYGMAATAASGLLGHSVTLPVPVVVLLDGLSSLSPLYQPAALLSPFFALVTYALFSCILGHVVSRRVYIVDPIRDPTVETITTPTGTTTRTVLKVRDERHIEHRHSKLDPRPYEVVDFETWSCPASHITALSFLNPLASLIYFLATGRFVSPTWISCQLIWIPFYLYHIAAYNGLNSLATLVAKCSFLRFVLVHTHFCCPTAYLTSELVMADDAERGLRRAKLRQLATVNVSDTRLAEFTASALAIHTIVATGVNAGFCPSSTPNPAWRMTDR